MIDNELRDRMHNIAKSKGWHDRDHCDHVGFGAWLIRAATWLARPWRRGPSAMQKLAWLKLVDDELDEAALETVVEYHGPDGKPYGILSEYADAEIRLLDMAGACGWEILHQAHHHRVSIHGARNMLVEAVRAGYRDQSGCMSLLFWAIADECEKRAPGYDVFKMIETKAAYNETRSYRHGGKLA